MRNATSQKVSVIIPHHNNYKILNECIQSLYKAKYPNIEIIVVDNNSSDNSSNEIKKIYNDIIVHKSDVNLGYAGGCNAGAKIASGKFLLFLNNDTIHSPNFINHLVQKINSDSKIASVQPKIKNYDNQNYFDYAGACGGFIDYLVFPFARGRVFNTVEKDIGQYDDSLKVFWTSGTAFITRKNIFSSLGGFDENLFAHMEEIDYCWKCYIAGYECWVEPLSEVFHHGGKTLAYNSAKKTYLNHRNSLILLLTNYNLSLSLYLFPLRFILEIISSLNELLKLRINHFLAHYIALLSILFNIFYLYKRRNQISQFRKMNDKSIFDKDVILKESIVKKYFLLRKKTFNKF